MNRILIKNIFHKGNIVDILIEGNRIMTIAPNIETNANKIVDGRDKAILPAFYNAHTHAAMTLLRGYADDMPLFKWLMEYIWPFENKLSAENIYDGTRLAILEMIRSGTVFFADMYWHHEAIIDAVRDMGIRANVGVSFIESRGRKEIDDNFKFINNFKSPNELISISVAPHAIYTVGKDLLQECAKIAKQNDLIFHIHLAETLKEFEECKQENNGLTPVEYLNSLGILSQKVNAAHCIHIKELDAEILSANNTTIVHNPCSNMKLASGHFNVPLVEKYGCNICLGTDGASSNNNLSMQEEMKFAALLAKSAHRDTTILPAKRIFQWATENGAKAFGIDAGIIEEGKLADFLIVDLNNERLVPNYKLRSNWVYSADSRCILSVVCNGKFLMENGIIENEEEIIKKAKVKLRETSPY